MSKLLIALGIAAVITISFLEGEASAARRPAPRSEVSNDTNRSGGGGPMMADITLHYVRDTRSDGATDSAAKVSLGGMFTSWLGLDVLGMIQMKSRNYLVGGDLRIMPTDWMFLKAGLGGYAAKENRSIRATPIAAAGVMAPLSSEFYLNSEFTYYRVNPRNNLTFGIGVGLLF